MLRRHVEGLEVVVVVLRFRTLQDLEAKAGENQLDLFAEDRKRMAVPQGYVPSWQCDVNAVGRLPLALQRLASCRELALDLLFKLVGFPTERRP